MNKHNNLKLSEEKSSHVKTQKKRKSRKRLTKKSLTKQVVIEQLNDFNLPCDWKEEATVLSLKYTRKGVPIKKSVQCVLMLLCRKHKIPSPPLLSKITRRPKGGKSDTTRYMDALRVLDGVTLSDTMDYIKYFSDEKPLPRKQLDDIIEALNRLPSMSGRNPRSIAGALLYITQNPNESFELLTQEEIAKVLKITTGTLQKSLKHIRSLDLKLNAMYKPLIETIHKYSHRLHPRIQRKAKVSVSIDNQLLTWVKNQIAKGRFASVSHSVNFALEKLQKSD